MWLTSEAKALSSDARVIPAIQYATQASIYQAEDTAAELTTAQTVIISFLYALKQKDLPFIKTLLEVSSTVPQIKSSFLSVWLKDDFCFPRGDVAICLSTLGKLLFDGLQFPWTIAATLASLDIKYCIRECFVEADDTPGQILLSTMNTCVTVGTQVDFEKELTSKESQTNPMKHVSFQLSVEKTSTGTQAGLIVHDRGVSVKPEISNIGMQTMPESSLTVLKSSTMTNTVPSLPSSKPATDQGFSAGAGIELPTTPFNTSGSLPAAHPVAKDSTNPFRTTPPTLPQYKTQLPLSINDLLKDLESSFRPDQPTTRIQTTAEEPKNDPVSRTGTATGLCTTPRPSMDRRTPRLHIDMATGKAMLEEYVLAKEKNSEKHPAETPKIVSSSSIRPASSLEQQVKLPSSLATSSIMEQTVKVEDGTKTIGQTGLVSNNGINRSIPKGIANEMLYCAIQKDDAKSIVAAINAGADVNDEGVMKKRPLHVAASAGRIEPAIELIHRGADVDSSDNWGETPLFVASVAGHLLMAEILVAAGADINHRNNEGNRPLHVAASAGQLEIVRLLLSNGADVDCRGESLNTPLHCAAIRGHLSVVGLLVDRGADPMAVDLSGHTPLSLANINQQRLVVEYLFYRSRR